MSSNQSWPNLVGTSVDDAVAAIKNENPHLNVVKLAEGSPTTKDFRTDRVRVFFDDDNKVSSVPHTG